MSAANCRMGKYNLIRVGQISTDMSKRKIQKVYGGCLETNYGEKTTGKCDYGHF